MYATTVLRKNDMLTLRKEDVDVNLRMIKSNSHEKSQTKHWLVGFYNEEA